MSRHLDLTQIINNESTVSKVLEKNPEITANPEFFKQTFPVPRSKPVYKDDC